jgi:hypothetical protein
MEPSPPPKSKQLVPIWIISGLVLLLVLAKPWLVDHLGLNQWSMGNRLILSLILAVICAVCIVVFRILNKPKSDA